MVAMSDQPSAVPMIMPSTSPMAQPVRQCTVALKASALSDWVPWCVVMRISLSDTPIGYEPEDRDPPRCGSRLVARIARVDLGGDGEIALALRALDLLGDDLAPPAADRDPGARVGAQVVVPGRVVGLAIVRG